MKLTFLGAVKSVTGSNYLLESGDTKILVDCGLHQGSRYCEEHNYEKFAFDPKEIKAVFISHAHIDHTGRLPQLVRSGFQGKIYSTHPTKDMAEALLVDSEHLLREEAEKHGKPPLYTIADVTKTVGFWQKLSYHEKLTIGPFVVELYDAGHVLGSASVVVEAEGKRIVFSGDLGNVPAPFIRPTEYIPDVDYALIESVYGGRIHERSAERKDMLEDAIEETVLSKGVLLLPAFALERTQEMIFELNELIEHGRITRIPVFIDSPLAIKLTAVYQKYSEDPHYFSDDSIKQIGRGDQIFNFPGLRMTLTTEESKAINDAPSPKVIMAGSGMSNGGRILHHERRYLSDPANTIVFVGHQGQGTLGRLILDGATSVKMFGEMIPVRCKKRVISGYSAHADQPQLMKWVDAMRDRVQKVFVVQGEEEQANELAVKLRDELAVNAVVPSVGESVIL